MVTLITCATPFNGSELANILRMLTNHESEQVDILTTANELQDVEGRLWDQLRRSLKPRLAHYAAYEMLPIALFKKPAAIVVRKDSAVLRGCEGQKGFEANHIDIVKPDSVHAPIYAWVADIISEREHKLITFPQLPSDAKIGTDKRYVIGPGTISVDRDIRIPANATLQIRPETTLRFEKGAILESEGRLEVGLDSLPGKGVRFDFAAAASGAEGGVLLRGLLTEGSSFKRCEFHGGLGISIVKPHPERHSSIDWARDASREAGRRTSGSAVACVGARGVSFEDCSFFANRASIGGAVAAYGSERLRFARCRFEGNLSGFGGGAAFVQEGEIFFQDCTFLKNTTGPEFDPSAANARYASGGALYLGVHANAELHGCGFLQNVAAYVGGACYLLDTNYHGKTAAFESVIADAYFIENRARASDAGAGGGGIRLDGESRLNLTDVWFIRNSYGSAWDRPGQSILDASQYSGFAENPLSGLVLNGKLEFCEEGRDPEAHATSASANAVSSSKPSPRVRNSVLDPSENSDQGEFDFNRRLAIAHRPVVRPMVVPIVSSLMVNPKCIGPPRQADKIDTIVIHHTSAINWADPEFQKQYAAELGKFETSTGELAKSDRKYDWRYCKEIFELYGVSAHYLIDREGVIRQLVPDLNVAYHAGASRMPDDDARTEVNQFSIGIELIASHRDDDPDVRAGLTPAYTEAQYHSLYLLMLDLCSKYRIPVKNVVGHDQIARAQERSGARLQLEGRPGRTPNDAEAMAAGRRMIPASTPLA